jgi:hypothetical protein
VKRKGRVLEYRVQVAPGPNDPDVAAALLEWLARPPRDAPEGLRRDTTK